MDSTTDLQSLRIERGSSPRQHSGSRWPLRITVALVLATGEALLLGALGGVVGCLFVLPLQGVQFGTRNSTFSEIVFGFRTTPLVMVVSIAAAMLLGIAGGLFPALRAVRMTPTQALRRG